MTPADTGPPVSGIIGDFAALGESLGRVTVRVRTRNAGHGSGIVWRPDGVIVTNAHVVRERTATVVLFDGRVFEAQRIAWDPTRDLAALRIDADGLPTADVGNSDALRPGELVLAVGNPFGCPGALTAGIVHAIGAIAGPRRRAWVQAAMRLAPGNSGGPLADARGRVIGITAMIVGGLALAVPSNTVARWLS
jgi:serine protease Do